MLLTESGSRAQRETTICVDYINYVLCVSSFINNNKRGNLRLRTLIGWWVDKTIDGIYCIRNTFFHFVHPASAPLVPPRNPCMQLSCRQWLYKRHILRDASRYNTSLLCTLLGKMTIRYQHSELEPLLPLVLRSSMSCSLILIPLQHQPLFQTSAGVDKDWKQQH